MARKSAAAPRPPREVDGLVGRTAAERAAIESRIARLSAAKARVEGRPLSPSEVAVALGADALAPLRPCSGCRSLLPRTREYFNTKGATPAGGPRWDYLCRSCRNRRLARRDRTVDREKARERDRAYRERRRARIAGGEAAPAPPPLRARLLHAQREARRRLARCADPARAEAIRARIADRAREIDRLASKDAS